MPQHRVRVAVFDDYQRVALRYADWKRLPDAVSVEVFDDHVDDLETLAARLRPFQIVVLMRERTPFPADLIEALPKLRLIVTTGPRNPSIDVAAAAAASVTVCGTESMTSPTVEHTWALMLGLLRNIPADDRNVREGRWQEHIGQSLEGHTLGILGLGRIGGRVAAIARAFQMTTIGWSRTLDRQRAEAAGVTAVTREELFSRSDVVTVHLRQTPETVGIVGADEFALMRPTAYLVNTARAGIVDEDALRRALASGAIAGAALDVYSQEPLPVDHPLRTAPNTVLSPHMGYVTEDGYRLFYGQAVEDIAAFLAGSPIRVIEPA